MFWFCRHKDTSENGNKKIIRVQKSLRKILGDCGKHLIGPKQSQDFHKIYLLIYLSAVGACCCTAWQVFELLTAALGSLLKEFHEVSLFFFFFWLDMFIQCIAIPRGKISEEGHVSGQPKVLQILLLVQQSNRNNRERKKKKDMWTCYRTCEDVTLFPGFQVCSYSYAARTKMHRYKSRRGKEKKKNRFVV